MVLFVDLVVFWLLLWFDLVLCDFALWQCFGSVWTTCCFACLVCVKCTTKCAKATMQICTFKRNLASTNLAGQKQLN